MSFRRPSKRTYSLPHVSRALGYVANWLGRGGKFGFTEDPSLVLMMSEINQRRGCAHPSCRFPTASLLEKNRLQALFPEAKFLTQTSPWGLWSEVRKERYESAGKWFLVMNYTAAAHSLPSGTHQSIINQPENFSGIYHVPRTGI